MGDDSSGRDCDDGDSSEGDSGEDEVNRGDSKPTEVARGELIMSEDAGMTDDRALAAAGTAVAGTAVAGTAVAAAEDEGTGRPAGGSIVAWEGVDAECVSDAMESAAPVELERRARLAAGGDASFAIGAGLRLRFELLSESMLLLRRGLRKSVTQTGETAGPAIRGLSGAEAVSA
jgi:hypothetical protein